MTIPTFCDILYICIANGDGEFSFGYGYTYTYLQEFCSSHGAKVEVEVVTSLDEPKDAVSELVEDMLAIVTGFSAKLAKLYGKRSQQFKKKIEQVIKEDLPHVGSNKNHQNQDSKPQ